MAPTLPALIGMLIAGTALQAVPADRHGICHLLTRDEIHAVQGTPAKDVKSSVDHAKGLEYAQCVYATADFVRSVSLTVISGDAPATTAYWKNTFRPERSEAALKAALRKKELPRAVPALGDEAHWTSDARAGALYVRQGNRVVRVSVGGVADETERLRRSRALAETVLKRMEAR